MSDHKSPQAAHDAAQLSTAKRPRKKRKSLIPASIDQAVTAIATYRDPVLKKAFRGMRKTIVEVMEGRSLTAAEVRWELRKAAGIDVPESTINGQLHSLFHSGHVTDHDTGRQAMQDHWQIEEDVEAHWPG